MADWTSLMDRLNRSVRDSFGREVQYVAAATGRAVTIKAIFQTTHEADAKASGNYAVAFVVIADLPAEPERGDQIVVSGVAYRVYEVENDNQGGARVGLHQ